MNFFLDIDNAKLVSGVNNPQTPSAVIMTVRDLLPVVVTVLKENTTGTGNLYTPTDLTAGISLFFGAKTSALLSGGFFIQQAAWTRTGTGVYASTLSLREAALIAAVGVNTSVSLIGEFVQTDGAGGEYSSIQFDVTVRPDVARGGEASATVVSPDGLWSVYVDNNGDVRSRRVL